MGRKEERIKAIQKKDKNRNRPMIDKRITEQYDSDQ